MFLDAPDLIPVFKPHLRIAALADDVLLVLSETRRLLLRGRAVVRVAAAIDGRRCAGGIAALLGPAMPAHEVLHLLDQLFCKGHLDAGTATALPTQAQAPAVQAWWETLGDAGGARRLAALTVSVGSVGGLDTGTLAAGLARAGIACGTHEAALHILLTDDYLRAEVSEAVRAAGVPVLLARPTGVVPTIGPLIAADGGSCLGCLQFWIRANHPVEAMLARRLEAPCHLPPALAAPGEQAVHGMLAAALAAGPSAAHAWRRHLLALDLRTLETRRHAVVKRPQCPHCGDPTLLARRAEAAPDLQPLMQPLMQPHMPLLRADGGYRRCDPEETLARYAHLVGPVTGAVNYLHPMPGRHQGARKVYVAGYMVSPRDGLPANGFDRVCAGKGRTDEQARASALCEALERYSGVYQGDEPRVRASMAALGDGQAIHFNDLQGFSERQFAQRARINALSADRRRQVPERFDAASVIDWTPAWSLSSGRRLHVPFTYCYAEAPPEAGARFGMHNPNGAAAGNCLEEAVLQGVLELVERDACAIWWYNRIAAPAIDLDGATDPYARQLRDDYTRLGWELWALDLTHDLGIPVCAALAHRRGERRFAIGFGCHLDGGLALQRALTELNQLFDPAGTSRAPWDADLLGDDGWLFPGATARRPAVAPAQPGGIDLRADIDHCVRLLARRGMDTLVVDKTRPDIGLHVAQVIVPGLRHFWPRFGPGRLYEVPAALGWRARALDEDGLNPAPLFL